MKKYFRGLAGKDRPEHQADQEKQDEAKGKIDGAFVATTAILGPDVGSRIGGGTQALGRGKGVFGSGQKRKHALSKRSVVGVAELLKTALGQQTQKPFGFASVGRFRLDDSYGHRTTNSISKTGGVKK